MVEDVHEVAREEVAEASGPDDAPPDDAPPLDPDAIRRSYQLHRARRRARIEHRRRTKWAGARFWVVLVVLVAACVFLALTTWREVGRLFGL